MRDVQRDTESHPWLSYSPRNAEDGFSVQPRDHLALLLAEGHQNKTSIYNPNPVSSNGRIGLVERRIERSLSRSLEPVV